MLEKYLVEILLISWTFLILKLNKELINKYPIGLSRKKAYIKYSQSFFYSTLALVLCCLLYFSSWIVDWSSRLALPIDSSSSSFAEPFVDIFSIFILSGNAIIASSVFIQEKRNLVSYNDFFGLTDILPNNSLEIIINLPTNKQKTFSERLSWLIEEYQTKNSFQFDILFDKDELIILTKIFSLINADQLDSKLLPIYQEITQIRKEPKPFRVTL